MHDNRPAPLYRVAWLNHAANRFLISAHTPRAVTWREVVARFQDALRSDCQYALERRLNYQVLPVTDPRLED